MALQNPSNLYTGGAVVLQDTPSAPFYSQLAARRQAKDEALNQYFSQLPNKINTAGVRVQDLDGEAGGINKDIQAWRENWLKNKEAIKKGGMPQQEHMAKMQDISRKIEMSKQAAKRELELGKLKFEGKFDPDEDDLQILDRMGSSIYDPKHYKDDGVTPFDWGDLSPNVPAFEEKKFVDAAIAGMKPSKQYGTPGDYDDKTGMRRVPFELKFNKEEINKIAETGARYFDQNRSARKYANKVLREFDSPEYQELNKAYQTLNPPKQYVQPDGKIVVDQDIMDTPEKVGKALAILRASGSFGGGEELKIDVLEKDKRDRAKAAYNSSLIAGRQRSSGGGNIITGNQFDVIDLNKFGNPTSGSFNLSVTDIPESVKAILKTGGYDLSKDKFVDVVVDENGMIQSLRPLGSGGKPKGIITRTDMENAQLKYNAEPQKSQQPTFGNKNEKPASEPSSYKIKGKTYSEADLLKMGYTVDQIKPYKQ